MIYGYPRPDGRDNIVFILRASDDKQTKEGDTFTEQESICFGFIDANGVDRKKVVEKFTLVETAGTAKEKRLRFQKILDYCEDSKNRVGMVLLARMDRITRDGYADLLKIKQELEECDIKVQDTENTFGEVVSSMSYLGYSKDDYPWSAVNPTEDAEIAKAQNAKRERNIILTRMIGKEISYAREGYWTKSPPFGFNNIKVETPSGLRTVLEPREPEADWVKKIFELLASQTYSDEQVVEIINKMGYISRQRRKWDRMPNGEKKLIGIRKGIRLDVKKMRKLVKSPIYCGLIYELRGRKRKPSGPYKAKFNGLVSISLFNTVNNGKVRVMIENGEYKLLFNQKPQLRLRDNPQFPYKRFILCPICRKPLIASASTGKSGRRFSFYHCTRNHKRFSVSAKDLETTVTDVIRSLEFTEERKKEINDSVLTVWQEKEEDSGYQAQNLEKRILLLREKKNSIKNSIVTCSSPILKSDLEADYEKAMLELSELEQSRNIEEEEELEINRFLKYVNLVMEHPYRLVMDAPDSVEGGLAFSAFFNRLPTYTELVNRTLDLKPIYRLKLDKTLKKASLVTPWRIELQLTE